MSLSKNDRAWILLQNLVIPVFLAYLICLSFAQIIFLAANRYLFPILSKMTIKYLWNQYLTNVYSILNF